MRQIFLATCCMAAFMCWAGEIEVTNYRYIGPFAVKPPVMIDKTDVNAAEYDDNYLLELPIKQKLLEQGRQITSEGALPSHEEGEALHMIGFGMENERYTGVTIKVKGVKKYQLFVDGKKRMTGHVMLEPTTHQIVVKYLTHPEQSDSVRLSVEADTEGILKVKDYTKHHKYNIYDVLHATKVSKATLSPNGKYVIISYLFTAADGKTSTRTVIRELATGRQIGNMERSVSWLPTTSHYYYAEAQPEGTRYTAVDPATGKERVFAENVPSQARHVAATEEYIILEKTTEGPKEDQNVYQVLEPDDRQAGWRNRSNLLKYDIKTGAVQPLTYGHHQVSMQNTTSDGKYMLFMARETRLEQRPTTIMTLYLLNIETMQEIPLVEKDGFINSGRISPDGRHIAIMGSPEALGGIGKNVSEGMTPSMTDGQLFIMDFDQKTMTVDNLRSVTRNFNPSLQRMEWSRADGMLYFSAEDKDSVNLFQYNPKNGQIKKLDCKEEVISSFSCAVSDASLVYYGVSASNSDRIYVLNTKNMKSTLLDDVNQENLKHAELGDCKAWTFKNKRGEDISARYYLPADFNPSRQYPMIVNYYGGCSPTSRNFESRYPHHAYASLGYVVLVINPSGATGFGQEFSARHVNTAGEGVADDIIEGTKQFCKEHRFVDSSKIGCIGASYGGFMTQYLQTVTDIFAAAVSHAGISDHTSYWGEGYWGYSYSEVSMANSYPWTDKQLYVDQSPLYNADKIHTPILFLHGDADTNVPVGESIQMFTALKLLGRETAMVLVKGQNHHITEYQKRLKWQNTIYAWFAKYLQDDSSWWDALYTQKEL